MKRTIKADDLFDLEFLQSGGFSPDGSKIVYSVSFVEGDKEYCSLWMLTLGTGETRNNFV